MHKTTLDGLDLACETTGSGEPVLLIGTGPIPDSFLPFFRDPGLRERHRLVRYRQRGQNGGASDDSPVSFAQHAADAAALLASLGIRKAHVAGHSTGADIALQLAADHPDLVHTLALLEPPLSGVASAADFFGSAQPAVAAYAAGDREAAVTTFLGFVSSLGWETCRDHLDRHVPGSVSDALRHGDVLFRSYLPSLAAWEFGPGDAATIAQPVLSVVGTDSERFFIEGHEMLKAWFPQLESCVMPGVAHLLHLQQPQPVVRAVDRFFASHPM